MDTFNSIIHVSNILSQLRTIESDKVADLLLDERTWFKTLNPAEQGDIFIYLLGFASGAHEGEK